MPALYIGGNQLILLTAATTVSVGEWYTIPTAALGQSMTFHAMLTASSVGATAGCTVTFEVANTTVGTSNSGIAARTVGLTCTTDTVAGGGTFISSMAGQWKYVRANLNSCTTSTAGSAGFPVVRATVSIGKA